MPAEGPVPTVEFDDRERTVVEDALEYYLDEYEHVTEEQEELLETHQEAVAEGQSIPVTPDTPDIYSEMFQEFAEALEHEIAESDDAETIFEFFEDVFKTAIDDIRSAPEQTPGSLRGPKPLDD